MKLVIAAVVVLVMLGTVVGIVMLSRKSASPEVRPYKDIREKLIKQEGSLPVASRAGGRSRGLDKRLSAAIADQLASIHPPTQANWSKYATLSQQVFDSVGEELEAIDPRTSRYDLLSPSRRAVHIAYWLEAEINNGGFDQYYLNTAGDGAFVAPEAMRLIDAEDVARLVEQANAQFAGGPSPDRSTRLKQLDALPDSAQEVWNELDGRFYELKFPVGGLSTRAIDFALKNRSEFFK